MKQVRGLPVGGGSFLPQMGVWTIEAKRDMMRRAILPKMVKGLYGRVWRKCRNVEKLRASELTEASSVPENSLELFL